MKAYYGYTGGHGENELVQFIKESLKTDEGDVIKKIQSLYFPLGHAWGIIQAERRTEIKEYGGVREYCSHKIGKSYKTVNNCLRAWRKAEKFSSALAWYQDPKRNSPWQPQKASGPEFVLELVAAWEGRDKPSKPKAKSEGGAKAALQVALRYKEAFERLGVDYCKVCKFADYEPKFLRELQKELGMAETGVQLERLTEDQEGDVEEEPAVDHAANVQEAVADVEPTLEEKAVRRRPGRPRKNFPAPVTDAGCLPSESKGRRGRGRSRKGVKEATEQVGVSQTRHQEVQTHH